MTTRGIAAPYTTTQERRNPWQISLLWRTAVRLTPQQGWDTLLLMVGAVGMAAWTLCQAAWAETPGLLSIIVWSSLAGLLLAKLRAPWPLLHLGGLAIGFAVVLWQGSSLIEDLSPADQVREMWARTSLWYDAATSGGISTDLLPFTLALLGAAWLLGYLSSWFLFRSTNVWVGLVLAGTAMLTILSFLPEGFEARLFHFMFLAMLLVARVTVLQRRGQWQRAGIGFGASSGWSALSSIAGISLVVLAVAATLPIGVYVSPLARDIWNAARSPVASLEDEFARLFSGIPSRKELHGRYFGTTLPFQGKIRFNGDTVIWDRSEQPSYWLSRTYSRYTSQGWIAGETKRLLVGVGPEATLPSRGERSKSALVTQRLQPTFSTFDLLTGGYLDWVSRDATVETLKPLVFEIDLLDDSRDAELPQDIQRLAQELRLALTPPPTTFVEASISRMLLPEDLTLTGVSRGDGASGGSGPVKIALARKEPMIPDVVSAKFTERLEANGTYEMRALISEATENDLRSAGTEYTGFLKDHYLQLPANLPQRVRDLAAVLTRGANTPMDKAQAIQGYLRGDTFQYSWDIEKPPGGADGVDFFLFESRKGYSDYFASAMAVMLRSAGVPARLAAGYAPGELDDESGLRAVKDTDSHGWVQVYFPGQGWTDFEPTPNWPLPAHSAPDDSASESDSPFSTGRTREYDCDSIFAEYGVLAYDEMYLLPEHLFDIALTCYEEDLGESAGPGQSSDDNLWSPATLLRLLVIAAAAVTGLWVMIWLMWTRGLAKATSIERLYTKMSRLGTLAGLGRRSYQTPMEYAMTLGNAIPAIAADAQKVAWAFATGRYGRQELRGEDLSDLKEAWSTVRGRLLARTLRRLVTV